MITRGRSLSDVLMSIASRMETRGWEMLFSGLGQRSGGGGIFGFLGGLLGFEGGGYTGSGSRVGGVDGRGGFPAILHPNETVIDHTKPGGGGQGQTITLRVIADEGVTVQQVQGIATNVAVQVVRSGMAQNRRALPGQLDDAQSRGV
jgi:hypothetical protein